MFKFHPKYGSILTSLSHFRLVIVFDIRFHIFKHLPIRVMLIDLGQTLISNKPYQHGHLSGMRPLFRGLSERHTYPADSGSDFEARNTLALLHLLRPLLQKFPPVGHTSRQKPSIQNKEMLQEHRSVFTRSTVFCRNGTRRRRRWNQRRR